MIKRKPSQEDLAYDDGLAEAEKAVPTDDVVDSDIIDIAGEVGGLQSPAKDNNRENHAIGRLVAGAAPTLFGFLFGPQQAERGMAQTQKFYASGKPSKLVPIVGEDGAPIYETPEDAIGEKVYQKPAATKSSGAGGDGKWLPGKTWVKDENGVEQLTDTLTNNASGVVVNAISKEPITSARSYITPKTYLTEDVRGGKNVGVIDPSLRGSAMINKEPLEGGLGSYYGVKTKGQAQTIEKGMEKGQEKLQEVSSTLQNIRNVKNILSQSGDAREVSATIYGLVRDVESKGVLTEQDFKNITGEDLRPFLSTLENRIRTKAFGDFEKYRDSYKKLAAAIEKKTADRLATLSQIYVPKTKAAQEGFKAITPAIEGRAYLNPKVNQAREWAKKNPTDPRAKKILKAIGEQ